MNTLFNLYDNIRTPKTTATTTIQDWFELIKKSDYSDLILASRPFGKKHLVYEENKAAIPAITYNFVFNGYKENKNINSATGLLYIDVDTLDFDINGIDPDKIFSYYKSFGGDSYALLVQVSGLTLLNYANTFNAICEDLGIAKFYDKNAKKATQFNVLSFDPDIYINYNSLIYSATDITDASPPSIVIEEKKKTYTISGVENEFKKASDVVFDNLGDIKNSVPEGQDCITNWDGWTYINCWVPFQKVKEGNRNNTLLSYCNNLVWLNQCLSITGAETILKRVNSIICEEPVTDAQIKRIVASIFKYKANGTLQPHVNYKKRKIVFPNYSKLTREQKLAVCRQEWGKYQKSVSINKLYLILEQWDFEMHGKIGQAVIYNNHPISKKTVEKYWSEFKTYVKDLNEAYYGNISEVNQIKIGKVEEQNEDLTLRTLPTVTIGNAQRYDRATQLIPLMQRWNIENQLTILFYSGYEGKKTLVAEDTGFDFDFNEGGVEFLGFAA